MHDRREITGLTAPEADHGQGDPRPLDLIATYYRIYAIFCAVFALGLELVAENSTGGGLLSHLDYDSMPGMPHAVLISGAGYLLMGMAIALCLWNLASTLRQWSGQVAIACRTSEVVLGFTYVMGAIIPYGLLMILLDRLWS